MWDFFRIVSKLTKENKHLLELNKDLQARCEEFNLNNQSLSYNYEKLENSYTETVYICNNYIEQVDDKDAEINRYKDLIHQVNKNLIASEQKWSKLKAQNEELKHTIDLLSWAIFHLVITVIPICLGEYWFIKHY